MLKLIADTVMNNNFQNKSPLPSKSLATNALLKVDIVTCRYINKDEIAMYRTNVLYEIIAIIAIIINEIV